MSILLDRRADVNAPAARYSGLTALQAASLYGHVDVVCLLAGAGADMYVQGGKCYGIALHAAAEGGQIGAIKELVKLGSGCQCCLY